MPLLGCYFNISALFSGVPPGASTGATIKQGKFVISHSNVFPVSSIHPFTTSAQVEGSTSLVGVNPTGDPTVVPSGSNLGDDEITGPGGMVRFCLRVDVC